jgi:hypothetical protein
MLSSAANGTLVPSIMAIFFILTAFSVLQLDEIQTYTLVRYASIMAIVFIFMSALGLAYYETGAPPLLSLPNADGRDNYLYLSTFSNSETFTIRPSAIYDEPGALSFYICVIVILRSLLGYSTILSAAMLLGGLLTQSIAHLVFCIIWMGWFLISVRSEKRFHKFYLNFPIFIFVVGLLIAIYQSGFMDWSIERALMFYENPWTNPRNRSMDEIFYLLSVNPGIIWFGFDATCAERLPICTVGLGENPLTPIIYGGIAVSWPYYLFMAFSFILIFFARDGLLIFGLAVLLLQRPYLLEFPYSATIALVYITWFFRPCDNRFKKCNAFNMRFNIQCHK